MRDVGRSASTDVPSGTSSLVGAPDEVFGTHKPPLYFTIKEMKSVLAEMDDQGWCELEPLGLETWMGRINAFASGERSRPAQVIRIPVFEGQIFD